MSWMVVTWILGALLVGFCARWLMTPSRHRPWTAALIGALWPVWLALLAIFLLLDLVEAMRRRI